MIAYDETGHGPSILLIHGVGLDRGVWRRCVPVLAEDHRVVTIDLPGHGASPPAGPGVTLADLAEEVAAVVPAPAHVVGFSLGALVATRLALTHPELVTTLTLVSGVTQRSDSERSAVLDRLRGSEEDFPAAVHGAVRRWFSDDWREREPETADEVTKVMLANDVTSYLRCYRVFATADAELWPSLGQITAPTLAVTGELDAGSTPAMSRRLADAVPHGRAIIIDKARHLLPLEKPAQLTNAILDHIRRYSRDHLGDSG